MSQIKCIFSVLITAGFMLASTSATAAADVMQTAPFAQADEMMNYGLIEMSSRYISPCRSWSYSMDARGYVCSSYDSSIEIMDAHAIRRQNNDLLQAVRELEERIQKLERR